MVSLKLTKFIKVACRQDFQITHHLDIPIEIVTVGCFLAFNYRMHELDMYFVVIKFLKKMMWKIKSIRSERKYFYESAPKVSEISTTDNAVLLRMHIENVVHTQYICSIS